jgi:hypothetical protein
MLDAHRLQVVGFSTILLAAGIMWPGNLRAREASPELTAIRRVELDWVIQPELTAIERDELEWVIQNERGVPPMIVVLAELTRAMPYTLWVKYLRVQGSFVRLEVWGEWTPLAEQALRQSPWIGDIELRESSLFRNAIRNARYVDFRLRMSDTSGSDGEAAPDAAKALLPYESENEAMNSISTQLLELAQRSGIELVNVRTMPPEALSSRFQRITAHVRTIARPAGWLRFIHEIESLWPRLGVCGLTVTVRPDKPGADNSVTIQVCGILKNPEVHSAANGLRPKAPRLPATLPDPVDIASQELFSPERKPDAKPVPSPGSETQR